MHNDNEAPRGDRETARANRPRPTPRGPKQPTANGGNRPCEWPSCFVMRTAIRSRYTVPRPRPAPRDRARSALAWIARTAPSPTSAGRDMRPMHHASTRPERSVAPLTRQPAERHPSRPRTARRSRSHSRAACTLHTNKSGMTTTHSLCACLHSSPSAAVTTPLQRPKSRPTERPPRAHNNDNDTSRVLTSMPLLPLMLDIAAARSSTHWRVAPLDDDAHLPLRVLRR